MLFQRLGAAKHSITIEHYHDVGKMLFAFVFFWGYIAFCQFMLDLVREHPRGDGLVSSRGSSAAGKTSRSPFWSSTSRSRSCSFCPATPKPPAQGTRVLLGGGCWSCTGSISTGSSCRRCRRPRFRSTSAS